ncbi:MAG TPA: helix-turn-helix domain-containing protein, partial [Aggregatilineaceae bacterium]|nr:helix-turn-helix domain-containing protein [Aggregatilineaceae bacterium]
DAQDALLLRIFGPLSARRNGELLTRTLVAFAQADFHLRRTAERMCLHPKSLRYRLQRITEIAGLDFNAPATRFEVQLAVQLMLLRGKSV